ncbi:hypothetical protein CWE12_07180 [Aliidiomarina sedimenti]|uniref:Major facilitator superfamily (MFS) profile domain-containing protein n=1 Tax=Aliidiomarina sedimenti TaxID=1933879 RepID=A0ABY0BYY9_9GAMM|nr:hypothetical protein [Aliidiomarina sedimenti]RUO29747.1 hypothetical protein CWE12_07180 [Aliidiomarina sedimenti]
MFSNLTNFLYERSAKQAFGFYLAYVILGVLIGALAGGIAGTIVGSENAFEVGARTGTIVAIIYTLVLGLLIAKSKGLLNSFPTLVLIALAGVICFFIGALGGLIPIAYLSTRPSALDQSIQNVQLD